MKKTTRAGRPTLYVPIQAKDPFKPFPVFVPAAGPVDPGIRCEVFDSRTGELVCTRTAGVIELAGVPHVAATATDRDTVRGLILVEFPDGPTAWQSEASAIRPAAVAPERGRPTRSAKKGAVAG